MDNATVVRLFREIAALLELKGANPFKIRAYRGAADVIAASATRVADLDASQLQELPGIGKDLAARIREIVETGHSTYHAELLAEFPPTILDLLKLQGVGPRRSPCCTRRSRSQASTIWRRRHGTGVFASCVVWARARRH